MNDESMNQPFLDDDDDVKPGPAGAMADLVRRALLAGVGAVFMTEEGLRKNLVDLKLPKEAFSYLAGQADRTRREVSRVLRNEIRRFLNSDAFKQEIANVMSGLTLEVKAEIRLKPTPKGPVRPEVDADVRVKTSAPSEADES